MKLTSTSSANGGGGGEAARAASWSAWIIDVDLVSSLLRRDIESASPIDTFFVDRSGGIDMRREVPRDDARSAALDWRRGSFSPSTWYFSLAA